MSGSDSVMSRANIYERLADVVAEIDTPRAFGRVKVAHGDKVEVEGLALPLGGVAFVGRPDGTLVEGEVVGVSRSSTRLRLLGSADGVVAGAEVEFGSSSPVARLSRAMMGRSTDALARPVDGLGPFPGAVPVALARSSPRTRRARRTLVRGGEPEDRAAFLAEAAVQHEGPVVALLVGGAEGSHRQFFEMMGTTGARTARVVEPGRISRTRARRAARVAGTLALLLADAEGRPALVVVDWRVPGPSPLGLAFLEASKSLWSLGRGAHDADFDSVIEVAAKREVA